jgi:hypothetical protein
MFFILMLNGGVIRDFVLLSGGGSVSRISVLTKMFTSANSCYLFQPFLADNDSSVEVKQLNGRLALKTIMVFRDDYDAAFQINDNLGETFLKSYMPQNKGFLSLLNL